MPRFPGSARILENLTAIANEGRWLATLWHLCFAIIVVSLAVGWKPSKRLMALLLSSPLLSASIMGWTYANYFNGLVLLATFLALFSVATKLSPARISRGPSYCLIAGCLMIGFGLAYPHFLTTDAVLTYFYAAPTGLIPCPTFSLLIGFALFFDGFGSRAWALILASVGLMYGLIGMLGLGVLMDSGLVGGAAVLFFLNHSRDNKIITVTESQCQE